MENLNANVSHAQVKAPSSTASEIADPNAEVRLSGKKRKDHKENSCELNDSELADILLNLSRRTVDQDTVAGSGGNNGMENPNPQTSHGKPNINDNVSSSGGRKSGRFIGVTDDRGRWQANIWLKDDKCQVYLGRYFIAEAAARSSDKAMLVTRDQQRRKLNYPEAEYDKRWIEEWREVFKVDVNNFVEELQQQSRNYSEGCTKGLSDEAGHTLLKMISEKKILEMGRY